MNRLLTLLCSLFLLGTCVSAQSEIRWTVNLNTDQITTADKRIFLTLEKDLVTFLNSQTWTNDRFTEEERIDATLFLTISEVFEQSSKGDGGDVAVPDQYKGTMALQSLRPIFGSSEQTPVLNTQDRSVNFTYRQGEAIQYSEQSYVSDLGHILAFYCYMVIGFDYDTFSPLGGQPYFDKAQELYNRLPAQILNGPGWVSAGRSRNRYWLMENVLNPKMLALRRAYYTYHRLGLDLMGDDLTTGRRNVTLAIEDAGKANQTYPNTDYMQAFVDAKRDEIVDIFRGAPGSEQNTVIATMSRVDQAKANEYRNIRTRAAANTRNTAPTVRAPSRLGGRR
ncbi:DUF4835 family protein [Neolewinella lacunae]|uniref:DUF4835 family protein n=1 Tax=Neolewinella lacunae TaxID=1517758 RepID=A0A923PS47_9BACT|nr:DUF4835 family protein [Neolewinella lacunae]MBC6996736.1 DUF4835 family protein [Neolewinella lacunae]MDN3633399.1 DUF4835 family protein [Neolewinella lacunae]